MNRNLLSIVLAAAAGCGEGTIDTGPASSSSMQDLTEAWSTEDLGGVAIQFSPSVIGDDVNKWLFYTGPNGHLWMSTHGAGPWWSAPVDLGGVVLTSAPSAVRTGTNTMRVFYRGPNGHLWYSSYDGGQWWGAPVDLGGVVLTSAPSAIWRGPNLYSVFYRGPNNHLFLSTYDGGPWWSGASDLGGVQLKSAPSAVIPAGESGHIRVFYRGPNDHLMMSSWGWDGPWWSGVADLGGLPLASDPSAASTYPHRIDVFYTDGAGQLWRSEYDGGPWWSAPYNHQIVLPVGAPAAARTYYDAYFRGANGHLFVAHPNEVVRLLADTGVTRWAGSDLIDTSRWCLPKVRIEYQGDPSRNSELDLFARDPLAMAANLVALDDTTIANGGWTDTTSQPTGSPRVVAMPFPPNPSWPSGQPTSVPLSTALFFGSTPNLGAIGLWAQTLCNPLTSPQTQTNSGAVQDAIVYDHGRCSSTVDLGDMLVTVVNGVWGGFSSSSANNPVQKYTKATSILARPTADPTDVRGGFVLGFHYSGDYASVGNEVWGLYQYIFGLSNGVLSIGQTTRIRTASSGVWGWAFENNMRSALENTLPQQVALGAQARQDINLGGLLSYSCTNVNDCAAAADSLPRLMQPAVLAQLGLPNATADQLNHLGCAMGSPQRCAAIGQPSQLANRWTCTPPSPGADPVCEFVLPAKRMNAMPDELELVWFDGPEIDNGAFAFAATGQTGAMCTAAPHVVATPPAQFFRGFANAGFGP